MERPRAIRLREIRRKNSRPRQFKKYTKKCAKTYRVKKRRNCRVQSDRKRDSDDNKYVPRCVNFSGRDFRIVGKCMDKIERDCVVDKEYAVGDILKILVIAREKRIKKK